jgi:roadblock/LC7 domain-containing protein
VAGHDLTTAQPGSTAALERYLADLAARLHGHRAARTRVLAEVRDGLTETIDAHLAGGMTPDIAAAAAVGEFGDPATVARSFAGELATASARRTIAAFIFTGPAVGIWWLLLLHPAPWRSGVIALLVAIPALPLIALAIATAAGTFATTGRLMRWLPETTGARALTAAVIIAALCLAGDLTVLGVLAVHLSTGWHGPAALIAAAVTASIVRIAGATVAVRSIHILRQRLAHSTASGLAWGI